MKHQPATPLPFAVENSAGNIEIVNEETLFTICSSSVGMRGPARKLAEQNIAYLIHAANAYPKLVAMVATLADHPDSPAFALLRELGEAAVNAE